MKISCPECFSTQTLNEFQKSPTVSCQSCGVSFLIPINTHTEIRRLKNSIRKKKGRLKTAFHKDQKQLIDEYNDKKEELSQKEKKELLKYGQQADPQAVGAIQVGITDSISLVLLKVVFGLYCIITIALTLFHMGLEYKTVEDGIQNDLQNIQKGFSPSLNTAVWNIDELQQQAVLKGMLQLPVTTGVKVVGPEGELLIASGLIEDKNKKLKQVFQDQDGNPQMKDSNHPFLRMIRFQAPLVYLEDKEKIDLGTVTLYSSSDVVLDKVGYVFLSIMVIAILKTLALWTIFLWISRRLLTRPLSRITQAATQFNLNNLDVPRIDIQTKGRNELKILAETFNEMWTKLVEERKQNEEMISTFEKFVPKQFLAKMAKGGLHEIPLGALEKNYRTTMLFNHLNTQTPLTSLDSEEMFQFINTYIDCMQDSIESNGGFVDRFVGSTIIASFELDTPAAEAMYAIYAVIGMQRTFLHFNAAYPDHDFSEIPLGIGIHSGELKIGTVGIESRMDLSVMGEPLEISEDLATLTLFYQCPILISENVFHSLPENHSFYCRKLDRIQCHFQREPLEIYEIFNTDAEAIRNQKEATTEIFEQGVDAFHQQQWKQAQQFFSQCLQDFPEDPVGREYLKRIKQCLLDSSM